MIKNKFFATFWTVNFIPFIYISIYTSYYKKNYYSKNNNHCPKEYYVIETKAFIISVLSKISVASIKS